MHACQAGEAPVIEDKQFDTRDDVQQQGMATIATGMRDTDHRPSAASTSSETRAAYFSRRLHCACMCHILERIARHRELRAFARVVLEGNLPSLSASTRAWTQLIARRCGWKQAG